MVWYMDEVFKNGLDFIWLEYHARVQNFAIFHKVTMYAAEHNGLPDNDTHPSGGYTKKEKLYTSKWHDKESQSLAEVKRNNSDLFETLGGRVYHKAIPIALSTPHWPFFRMMLEDSRESLNLEDSKETLNKLEEYTRISNDDETVLRADVPSSSSPGRHGVFASSSSGSSSAETLVSESKLEL